MFISSTIVALEIVYSVYAIHTLAQLWISAMNMKFRNLQLSADFNIQYNSLEILKLGEV